MSTNRDPYALSWVRYGDGTYAAFGSLNGEPRTFRADVRPVGSGAARAWLVETFTYGRPLDATRVRTLLGAKEHAADTYRTVESVNR